MEKLLYIGNTDLRFKSFKTIVDGILDAHYAPYSQWEKESGYSIVLIEYDNKLSHFQSMLDALVQFCYKREIPIILSTRAGKIPRSNDEMLDYFSGIVTHPYDSDKVISMVEILKSLAVSVSIPETKFLNTFVKAVIEVLATNTGKQITHKGTHIKEEYSPAGDISGSVYIHGNVNGVLELTFLKSTTGELLSEMCGCENPDENDKICLEGVGEILNQVSGKIKSLFWDDGMCIDFSLPRLKCKSQTKIISIKAGKPYHQLHFEFNHKPFLFNIQLSAQVQIQPHVQLQES